MAADDERSLVNCGPERDPYVFEACWRLYKRGETDLLEGGVSPTQIVFELRVGRKAVIRSLKRLCEEGVVVKLYGAKPTDYTGRASYAPVALHAGGEER